MSKSLISSAVAGLLSAGLFLFTAMAGLGALFLFLATLPLFGMGLSRNPKSALWGALAAALIILPVAGLSGSVLYLLLLGLPSWYIAQKSLLSKIHAGGQATWFPVGLVFTMLTSYACLMVILMVLQYTGQPEGLEQILARHIRETFANLGDEYTATVEIMATTLSFMVFAVPVWLWGLALYGHAWLANALLLRKQKNLRPDFALTVFPMPSWMLGMIAICALASLIGSPVMAFLGKTLFIVSLFPYFLLGMAITHAATVSWPSRRFFLFFSYMLLLVQPWLAFIPCGIGITHHIKRLSGQQTSSRN